MQTHEKEKEEIIPGQMEFIFHICNTAKKETNKKLNKINLPEFSLLSRQKDRYSYEYNLAKQIFIKELNKAFSKIEKDTINKIVEEL